MRKRLLVAASLAAAVVLGWGVAASTQEAMAPSGPGNSDAVARVLEHQAWVQHARTVDLRDRIESNALEYQARVKRDLGARAPVETIAPMATVAPVEVTP